MQGYFTRTKNRLLKQFGIGVATKVMKKQIEMGLLPKEFLNFLRKSQREKNTTQKARQRYNNDLVLKRAVFARDGFQCRQCPSKTGLQIHHIKSIKNFPEKSNDILNLITVCKKCHNVAHRLSPTQQ